MTREKTAEATTNQNRSPEDNAATKVVWDDSQMATSYANVINVFSSREEFTFLFGTNQTWNLAGSRELIVRLSNRIVLTPFAAKRLHALLSSRIQEYEQRFGKLSLD
jgi:hypothetical protein